MSGDYAVRCPQKDIRAKDDQEEPEKVIPVKEAVNAEKYHTPEELRYRPDAA